MSSYVVELLEEDSVQTRKDALTSMTNLLMFGLFT